MDDTRTSAGFGDEFNEFDNLLDDEVTEPVRSGRTGRMPVARAAHAPSTDEGDAGGSRRPRLRITPDWNRIAAVLFVGALVLLILWFAVTSIMGARRTGAYKDYFNEVRDLTTQSTAQGAELDKILTDPNMGDRSQRIASIEQLAKRATKLSESATSLDVPDQLTDAHGWLETTFAYRANGIDGVQRALTASIDSKDADVSANQVASAMSRLIASDAVYADSFKTSAKDVLDADEVRDVKVPDSVTVQDFDSVSISGIKEMLTRLSTSGTKTAGEKVVAAPKDGKIRGGALEGGRVTVSPSGQTLTLNGLTEIEGGDNIQFEVPFTNQGEVQLTDVPVEIVLRGDDSDPITLSGVIERVDPGQTQTAKVSLGQIPDFASLLEMDISVGPIPGEKTTDNNRASYQLQFKLPG